MMQLTREVIALGEATDCLLCEARRGGMEPALVASLRAELRGLRPAVIAFYERVDAALAAWKRKPTEERWRHKHREWLGAMAHDEEGGGE